MSIRSERSKTVLTGDNPLRGVRLEEGASPLRCSFDVSAVSASLKDWGSSSV